MNKQAVYRNCIVPIVFNSFLVTVVERHFARSRSAICPLPKLANVNATYGMAEYKPFLIRLLFYRENTTTLTLNKQFTSVVCALN